MRRSRNAPPKGDEGGDDSEQMVVGTGVTMDFSAVDDPSLTVGIILRLTIEGTRGFVYYL